MDFESLLAKCCAWAGVLLCLKTILAGINSPATVLYSRLYGFWFLVRVAAAISDILALHRPLHCTVQTCRKVTIYWERWVKHPGRCKVTEERWIEESRFESQSRFRFLPCSSFCHWFLPPCQEKKDALGISVLVWTASDYHSTSVLPQTLWSRQILGSPHLRLSV